MWIFFLKNVRFTLLILGFIIMAGLYSLFTLPKEASPEVKVPFASIATFYPGASPIDVEDLVTNPIEDAVINLDDVKKVTSTSSEAFSIVSVEFETDADIKDRVRALQDAVNNVEGELPAGVESPLVREVNFSDQPVLILALSAQLPYSELLDIAERMQDEIELITQVSSAQLTGVRPKILEITLKPEALSQYGVSVLEVLQVLQQSDGNFPLGSLEAQANNYNFRLSAALNPEDLGNLVVRNQGPSYIYLRDLADIRDTFKDASQISRVSVNGGARQEAISIQVFKKPGGDLVRMVDEINARLKELQETDYPEVTVMTVQDNAQDIRDQLGDLTSNGEQSVLLIFFALALVLGLREATLAAVSIPLTFLLTFMGLQLIGSSFNFLSLFSLIFATGILVDTGIVIVESMHLYIQNGDDAKTAAFKTIREYQVPLLAGTLTNIAAFVPMFLMTGIIGEFVKHIPRTVVITLLASLIVCMGILPVLGMIFLKAKPAETVAKQESVLWRRFKAWYIPFLEGFLKARWRTWALLFLMVVMLVGTVALPVLGVLNVSMFPAEDSRLFFIQVELPKGSRLEDTDAVVSRIEDTVIATPEVESYIATLGSNGGEALGGVNTAESHLANFTVNLKKDRERTSLEILDDYRTQFAALSGEAKINLIGVSGGPPGSSAISFRIFGPDLKELRRLSNEAIALLEAEEGTVNVSSSLQDQAPEYVLRIDREHVASAGLTPAVLGQIARIALSGLEVSTLTRADGKDVDLILKTKIDDIEALLALPISTPSGDFPLGHFIQVNLEPAPSTIVHQGGERSVEISSDVEGETLASVVLPAFQAEFAKIEMPQGYRVEYGGEAEEMAESFASLGQALIIGILLILIILLLQFNSFSQTFVVLLTIPFGIIGVFLGLALVQQPFSFPAFIGLVALSGIVVNNGIILLDRIASNRSEGMPKKEAILEASNSRLQPIVLTSITSVIGMLPLALSSPTWAPLGFTIVFGMLFSTVLTLVVIPASYGLFVK